MILRAGRADLADALDDFAQALDAPGFLASKALMAQWREMILQARDAVLHCPHTEQCTTCFTIEKLTVEQREATR